MIPYYDHAGSCACGCGQSANAGRAYVSGHNLRNLKRTDAHCAAISEGQIRAWRTKRKRMPLGSKWLDASGYLRVKVSDGKWQLEHVIVMSRILGRPVARGEVVHHINGDKTDNSDGNLYLCRDHKHHIEIERSLFVAFRSLLGAGAARFNRETALYEAIL